MVLFKHQLQVYLNFVRAQSNHAPQKFIIFGRGRSGSTTLVSLLNCLPEIDCDGEILAQPVLWPQLYLKARAAQAHNSVYGCKLLSYQLRDTHQIRQGSDFLYELSQAGVSILYLRRENLLEHAISNIRARSFGFHQSKFHQSNFRTGVQQEKIYVEPKAVVDWMEKSQRLWEYELSLLRDIPYMALTYEKNLASETQHQPTIDAICRFLGIQSTPAVSKYQKVSPQTLQASVENYGELVYYLKSTPYERYLDVCPALSTAAC
ncbi:nodulation protein h [Leptolyngbya sp. Heron Island J]|uniref:nodulation protein h n=1 Tax=Leptolyngbya sp. Heron Island J TaxID=1385935 RepID=UPI0003B9A289|nr:nodulation protein h [Leptolyngbya sp. Heron Island J]ESA37064.1 nodulation protein h [Leptolyngbya sp. Heron Island J]